MAIIILILIGLCAAIVGALVGLGGGVFIVPLLLFFGNEVGILSHITPQTAVGTSSFVLIFIGLSAMLAYRKSGQIDRENGIIFLIGILPGALLGSYTNRFFTVDSFYLYFGLFMIFLSILLIYRNKIRPFKVFQSNRHIKTYIDKEGHTHSYGFHPIVGVIAAFVVGFFTGLFGIGGGALMTPIMLLLFKMPSGIAIGTSMMMVFFGGVSSATGHLIQGNVLFFYALFLIPAAYIGAKIGVKINQSVKSDTAVTALRIVLMLLGIYLMLQTFI